MARGEIELIRGPMFSGKTDQLIRRLRVLEREGHRARAAKPTIDARHPSDALVSHSGARYPAQSIGSATGLEEVAQNADVVGIDEAQFFDEQVVDVVLRLRKRVNRIIVAGLDFDYRRDPFATVAALADMADTIETRAAICALCGRPAEFTQRVSHGQPASRTDARIRIGGVGLYEPRCRLCHAAEDALNGAVRAP